MSAAGPTTEIRQLTVPMRVVLQVGGFLVFLAGIQLFVLTEHTEKLFAWTIGVPLTAAFLGAFYWTALVLALLSSREKGWANARVAVPGVFLFILLTLTATLIHRNLFHFHGPGSIARGAAWLWLTVYVAVPLAVLVVWIRQLRVPGQDPPRQARLPGWYRWLIAAQAAVLLFVGVAFFVTPGSTMGWWPWVLTPLTARAVAAWLIGLGVVLGSAVWEDDWRRIRPASISYLVLGALQLVALARYPHTVAWGTTSAWAYLAFLATVLAAGIVGTVNAGTERKRAGQGISAPSGPMA